MERARCFYGGNCSPLPSGCATTRRSKGTARRNLAATARSSSTSRNPTLSQRIRFPARRSHSEAGTSPEKRRTGRCRARLLLPRPLSRNHRGRKTSVGNNLSPTHLGQTTIGSEATQKGRIVKIQKSDTPQSPKRRKIAVQCVSAG